jgi:hypothetical protein
VDGTDPRLEGGAISQTAWSYTGPIALPGLVSRVRARLKNGNEWSAIADVNFFADRVVVGEFLAKNTIGITDNMGEREDWIEIHNPLASSVDLSGFYLTDNIQQPTKWTFPSGSVVAAGGRLLIWADDQVFQGPNHASFKLSNDGEQIWLIMPDGSTIVDGLFFGPQLDDVATGRLPDGDGSHMTLFDPTPSVVNVPLVGVVRFGAADASLHPLRLGLLGSTSIGTSGYLVASTPYPNHPHYFIAGTDSVSMPVPGSTTRLLAGPVPMHYWTAVSNVQGTALAPLAIPAIPSLIGQEATFQVFVAVGTNILSSNGLKVRVGP